MIRQDGHSDELRSSTPSAGEHRMAGTELEKRLRALEDIEAIRRLKACYLSCCDRKDPAGMRACFADGPVDIDYGVVGRFDHADALVELFSAVGCHEHMVEMHHGMNAQIDVLDESRAFASWSLHYVLINTQAHSLTQLGGYYEDRYVRQAGIWKIAATRFVVTSTLVLDLSEGNAKTLFAGRAPPAAA
jgi:hypothetical protein